MGPFQENTNFPRATGASKYSVAAPAAAAAAAGPQLAEAQTGAAAV